MPELPEVETIKRALSKKIVGLKIKQIQVLNPNSFHGNPNEVRGEKILNIDRKAKLLLINLSRTKTLIIHLKMSGQLILISNDKRLKANNHRFTGGHPTPDMNGEMPNKSTRVIFGLGPTSNSPLITHNLYFNDQRKFGWIKLVNSSELIDHSLLNKLGPEPLEKEFTWQILKSKLINRKTLPIKVALLDQSAISGIGNIYASEACFIAGINPHKKASTLTDAELKKLHKGIIESLNNGIKYGGSSKTHFVDPEGRKGYFLDYAYVYGRDKKPCKKCSTPISKIQLRGRGTYFCRTCQLA